MIDFERYVGYEGPKVIEVNEHIHIVTHKAIAKGDIDIIDIYNKKQNTYITLYNTTLYSIYNLMNTKKKIKNKRKSPKK